jgi:hypothetical protein
MPARRQQLAVAQERGLSGVGLRRVLHHRDQTGVRLNCPQPLDHDNPLASEVRDRTVVVDVGVLRGRYGSVEIDFAGADARRELHLVVGS